MYVISLTALFISCERTVTWYFPEDWQPTYSPSGTEIAFTRMGEPIEKEEGWSHQIWLANINKGTERFLTYGVHPNWAPDSAWIAFSGKNHQIYKITCNGDSLVQLTFKEENYFPRWSPNGKQIAWYRKISFTSPEEIWIMDSNGKKQEKIALGSHPTWSPDGMLLAYVVSTVDSSEIWQIDRTTGMKKRLYFRKGSIDWISWSPTSRWIAFACKEVSLRKEAMRPQVFVINTVEESCVQLTKDGGTTPCWAPDASKIIYCKHDYHAPVDREGNGRVWIIGADGTSKKQLTGIKSSKK